MPFIPGQARVGVVAAAPANTSDAAPDMARIDVQTKGREASSPLVALLPAGDGDVVVSLDQVVADVEPLVRVVPSSSAVVPYPAAVVTEVPLVLHGPAYLLARNAVPTPREATETTTLSQGPMPAVLLSVPRRVEKVIAQIQPTGTAAGAAHGAEPRPISLARGKVKIAAHATQRPPVIERKPVYGHIAVGVTGAVRPGTPLAKGPKTPRRQDGLQGAITPSSSLPLLARTEATRLTIPRRLPHAGARVGGVA